MACAIAVQALPTIASPPPVPIATNGAVIAAKLKSQPSVVDRFKTFLTDSDALRNLTVFDFNNQTTGEVGKGGTLLLATVDNFPILEELGISAGLSFIEPCGLNIPHLHLRANEFLTVIEGVLDTGFVQGNGFNTEIETVLGKFQGTVFPMGSIHYKQNPTCNPAIFVAGLSSEDPGRSDIATSFFMLPSDVVDAALGFPETIGNETIAAWKSHLPANLALGVESCLTACGIPF
ncbi:RmlC-like cupin domain-containing protein [Mycena epipterygia]|nr:RmlC-like cupin domain-containing protein [Mycena epipterygia]